jgi:hypothetical protein
MFTTINIVIGLVFVLLLFSLLASTVMEVMASIFALRSKHLRATLEIMLDEKTGDFFNHPLFQQLRYASSRRTRLSAYNLPTYISKKTFTAILEDILPKNEENTQIKLQSLPDGRFKQMLLFLSREADGNAEQFKEKIGFWFDEIMERASEWYKGNLKWWLFAVGFGLACIFNVDTIQVYQTISTNATVQEQLLAMATDFVDKNDSIEGPNLNLTLEESITRLDSSLQRIEHIRSPLGLGWSASEGKDLPWLLIKLAGLLLTGISVTFGAPFWFDILKKLLSLGRGGSAEKNAEPKPETVEKVVVIQPKTSNINSTSTENEATNERSINEEENTPVG